MLKIDFLRIGALFCTLALWPFLSFSPALMQIALWVGFALALIHAGLARQKPALPDRLSLVLLGIFLAAVFLSILISDYPKQSFRGALKILRQIAIFLLVFHVFKSWAAQKKMRWVIAGSFLLLVADGFFQYFHGTDFLRGFQAQDATSGRRISASLEHYGKLAAYLCAVFPLILGFTCAAFRDGARKKERWLWLALALAGGLLLVMTRSRGGMLAFFLMVLTVLLLRHSWKSLLAVILAGALFLCFLPKSMVIHLDAENKEQSVVERLELWHRAWDVIQARPWTGTGINTYAVAHQQYDTRQNWRVKDYYAHNGYLQTAAEVGVPGTSALVLFFLGWLWRNKPNFRDHSAEAEINWGAWGGMLAFLIFALGDTAMHSPQPVAAFWYVTALLGAFGSRPAQAD